MIITVTPNPSIDRTQVLADPLGVGAVNRVISGTDQAGGPAEQRHQPQRPARRG